MVFAAIAAALFMFAATSITFAQADYKVGDKIEVQYTGGGSWFKAEVLETKDGSYKIRYNGYGSSYDEWVTPAKMRRIAGALPTTGQMGAGAATTNFKVGDKVEAYAGGAWYKGAVIDAQATSYKIHFDGWGNSFDEWVQADNVRRIDGAAAANTQSVPNAPAAQQTRTGKLNKYGTRDARSCADTKAPARGPITAALAKQYFVCQAEGVSGAYLYLVENERVEVGGGRPYNPGQESAPQIDPSKPLYAIRGSYTRYQCLPEDAGMNSSAPGKNCTRTEHRKATGYCYRTTFGEWLCEMTDKNISNDDWHQGVAPPK